MNFRYRGMGIMNGEEDAENRLYEELLLRNLSHAGNIMKDNEISQEPEE